MPYAADPVGTTHQPRPGRHQCRPPDDHSARKSSIPTGGVQPLLLLPRRVDTAFFCSVTPHESLSTASREEPMRLTTPSHSVVMTVLATAAVLAGCAAS